jgi:hypothetical protein
MLTERWLTLPKRTGIRSPELSALLGRMSWDYKQAWDTVEDPRMLTEMAAAAGMPVELVLGAVGKCTTDAWSHWSGGATDPRPMQIVATVTRWLRREAGFEEIWGNWELAEHLTREVRSWYDTQHGAVLARAIMSAVGSVHSFATTARNLAEPEAGHDQHDPARYQTKNADQANAGLVHDCVEAVNLAMAAGVWWHTHTEPRASETDHDAYAKQILGFVLRQHLPADDVVQGLRDRLR